MNLNLDPYNTIYISLFFLINVALWHVIRGLIILLATKLAFALLECQYNTICFCFSIVTELLKAIHSSFEVDSINVAVDMAR